MKFNILACFLTLFCIDSSFAQLKPYPIHTQYKNTGKPIVVFLTGDGGWNTFSKELADAIGKNGYPTLSLDTRKYFWEQKNPAQFGADMSSIMDHYLKAWNKDSFYILGYSFGAEVAAFLPAHLSPTVSEKLKSLVLLSPAYSNSFEVRFINLPMGRNTNKDKYKVGPELHKIKVPVRCIFGDEEQTDISQELKDTDKIKKVTIPGSHHYENNIKVITENVIKGFVN